MSAVENNTVFNKLSNVNQNDLKALFRINPSYASIYYLVYWLICIWLCNSKILSKQKSTPKWITGWIELKQIVTKVSPGQKCGISELWLPSSFSAPLPSRADSFVLPLDGFVLPPQYPSEVSIALENFKVQSRDSFENHHELV